MNSHRRRLSSTHVGRLRRRSSASQSTAAPQVPTAQVNAQEKASVDMEVDTLERSMSALRFVPVSVTRNSAKAGDKPST